eukprot:7865183-Alexandrium_andersonii.AAC.1
MAALNHVGKFPGADSARVRAGSGFGYKLQQSAASALQLSVPMGNQSSLCDVLLGLFVNPLAVLGHLD